MLTSNHRGHGQAIAKGIDLNGMMAEILGKYTGTCKEGGSMHIADLDAGNLGANGIVGGGMGIAVGAAPYSTNEKRLVRLSSASLAMVQPMKVSSTKRSIWLPSGTSQLFSTVSITVMESQLTLRK